MTDSLREAIRARVAAANETLPLEDDPFPRNVIVEPTNICNLACAMCPSSTQTRPRGVMSLELWKRIVDEVAEVSPTSVIWPAVMGEAMKAGKRFLDMLDYACARGVRIHWNTNAVLLDDASIARIAPLPLEGITVGLDATTREVYEKIRIDGDFEAAVGNTLKLLERVRSSTRVTAQFIEQEANTHQKEAFREFWLSRGATVKIRPRLGWGDGVAAPELILSQDERVGPCPWLIRTVSIHWDGHVVQCDADWDCKIPAGHLDESSIQEVWQGELAARRARHRRGDFDCEPCRTCNDWQAGPSEIDSPERGRG
jgi:radical SAM protein with 4Fe4S-binding SPASM domain